MSRRGVFAARSIHHGLPHEITHAIGGKRAHELLPTDGRIALERHLQSLTHMGETRRLATARPGQIIRPERSKPLEEIGSELLQGLTYLTGQLTAKRHEVVVLELCRTTWTGAIGTFRLLAPIGHGHAAGKSPLPEPAHYIVDQIGLCGVRIVHCTHRHPTRRRNSPNAQRTQTLRGGNLVGCTQNLIFADNRAIPHDLSFPAYQHEQCSL